MVPNRRTRSVNGWGDLHNFRSFAPDRDLSMSVIAIFIAFVLVGDTAAVFISYLFERVSNFTSLLVFLALFVLVFGVAWKLAVSVTERYIVRPN